LLAVLPACERKDTVTSRLLAVLPACERKDTVTSRLLALRPACESLAKHKQVNIKN